MSILTKCDKVTLNKGVKNWINALSRGLK